jgi:hypothetical protein
MSIKIEKERWKRQEENQRRRRDYDPSITGGRIA